ncbi:hypothetical protein CEXT_298451 [Caerostris extrusa]|uniref:Uncharacterized protein n=1 Tax=Caerostris extrusa TaxID=172846 RepID=A0AAV4M7V1_CAEEX|nr:hypothetical protein CEXT_298451 [Caerostris extrusa]
MLPHKRAAGTKPPSKPIPSKSVTRKQVSERRFYTSRPADLQISFCGDAEIVETPNSTFRTCSREHRYG